MIVCGVDEAGRGPLAGPVTAAAVILNAEFPRDQLNDSKKLSESQRLRLRGEIQAGSVWAIGWATPEEIDHRNIHHATLLAMRRAIDQLSVRPDLIQVDGRFVPPDLREAVAVIHGDALVPEIMAASILAKTERDAWMCRYAAVEPLYLFEKHKGYPTAEHRALIDQYGPSGIHRYSFRATRAADAPS